MDLKADITDSGTLSLNALEDTLVSFESDWPALLDEDCNPLDIALTLTDENGLVNYQDFKVLKKQFTKNLQKSVNANYMSFNDSIGSYGISIETLNQSQNSLTNIRENLAEVDKLINSNSNVLGELNEKRMKHIQTLDVLKKISEVQKKIGVLQSYVENQSFEKAVNLVKEINDVRTDYNLLNIDSLQELQTKLNSLVSLLLEGLLTSVESNIYSRSSTPEINSTAGILSNRISINKGLLGFIKKINNKIINEDEELKIQSGRYDKLFETFKQIQRINKESECLVKLADNCEKEVKQIIKRSVLEIKNKYPSQVEMNKSFEINNKNDPFSSFNLLQSMNGLIIKELFVSIFQKVLSLIQRHIAINEIAKLNGYKYRIDKIWGGVQKQLSLVMFNYIIDENLLNNLDDLDLKSNNKNNDSPFNKTFKQFESSENGQLFQFSKLSLNSLSNDLINLLNNIFVDQGKGIVLSEFNISKNKTSENSIFIGVDDFNESKKIILVPPNIFNMAYIMNEFITFTNNVSSIYPTEGGNDITEFFNQFMDIVFVSQLENTLVFQFDKLCENKWKPNQLLEASNSFKAFFNKVFILLDTSVYYRPSYIEIIFKMLDKMSIKFKEMKDLLSKTNELKLLSIWIDDSKLKIISNDIVKNLLTNDDLNKVDSLQLKELTYALQIGGNYIPKINPSTFLKLEHMRSLVDLLSSLSNILNWLPELKIKIPDVFEDVGLLQKLKETWLLSIFNHSEFPLSIVNLSSSNNSSSNNNNKLNDESIEISTDNIYTDGNSEYDIQSFIALNSKAEHEFDDLLYNLKSLMNDVEILIRYEIRVECIWCIIQMMLNKRWNQYGDESVDLGVDKFCERINNISRIFNRVSKNILAKSKDEVRIRIFGGLEYWIDRLAIFESRRIEVIGKSGWVKMIVNLNLLQQAIKSINNDIDNEIIIDNNIDTNANNNNIKNNNSTINNSIKYFTLGSEGESFIMKIDKIKDGLNLSEEDWKNLIRLVYSEKLKGDNNSNANKKYMAAQARLLKGLAAK